VNKQYQPLRVLSISSAHFVHDIYSSFLPPLLPLLIEKFGISLSAASVLSLIQRLPSLFSIIVGVFAHRLPWRIIILSAPLLTAFGGSMMGMAPNIVILGIFLFTIGISSAIFHVPAPVMIKEYSGSRIGKGMSYYMLGGETARMLGPLLVVGAVSLWGLEGIWRLILPAFVATFILSLVIEKKPFEKLAINDDKEFKWQLTLKKYSGFFAIVTLFLVFRAVMKSSLSTFLPVYMGQKGNNLFIGAVSLSILQIAGAFGSFIGGSISDKWGRFNTLLSVAIVSPILMFLFINVGTTLQFFVLLLLGVVLYSSTPILLALVQEQGSNQPALMNASFTTINFITGALAVLATGFLGDLLGLDLTYKLSAFLSLGSIPAVFLIRKKANHTGIEKRSG